MTDGWLSLSCWLTDSGHLTHKVGCTVNWATNQLGDRRLGDKPTGRQMLDDWATRFGQLGDKAIANPLHMAWDNLYNCFCLFATASVICTSVLEVRR